MMSAKWWCVQRGSHLCSLLVLTGVSDELANQSDFGFPVPWVRMALFVWDGERYGVRWLTADGDGLGLAMVGWWLM
jgi:hypothetical protein